MRGLWVVLGLATGCGGGANCDLGGVGEGALRGSVNGEDWTASGAGWSQTGTGLQILSDVSNGYRITLSALQDINGIAVTEVISSGDFPIEIDWSTDQDGFALLYPQTGGSASSKEGSGGSMTIQAINGGVLEGCFAFEAVSGPDSYEVEAAIRAEPL